MEQARAHTHWYLLYKLRNVTHKYHDSLPRRENVYDTQVVEHTVAVTPACGPVPLY